MPDMIREPIGLRVLIRALRPDDREPFLFWRAYARAEADALIEVGEAEDRAELWAALLRWREAEAVAARLMAEGWEVSLQGIRAIALAGAVAVRRPPSDTQGWLLAVGDLTLRAVPETPDRDEREVERMLAFLDDGSARR